MKEYATAQAFKTGMEARLRQQYGSGFVRARQRFVFQRFLARVASKIEHVTVKGGVALELRLRQARATKDIDLGIRGLSADRDQLLARFQEAARLESGSFRDYLVFAVAVDPDHPDIVGEGVKYGGFRFRVTCQLAGSDYGRRHFGLDVAFGNPVLPPIDELTTEDWLGHMGIKPPTIPTYPIETHIAEKLHAYTLPRAGGNGRMKDLPDLRLLGMIRDLSSDPQRNSRNLCVPRDPSGAGKGSGTASRVDPCVRRLRRARGIAVDQSAGTARAGPALPRPGARRRRRRHVGARDVDVALTATGPSCR